jgi:PRTRC genetic system protein C
MQVLNLTRKFKYNSVTLPDPNESMSPDQVREFFATQYPELNNALLEGPVTANGVSTWTFVRAAGAKGRSEAPVMAQGNQARELIMKAMATGAAGTAPATLVPVRESAQYAGRLVRVLARKESNGQAMSLPSSAFGIWG